VKSVRLTEYAGCGGCSAKVPPSALRDVLASIDVPASDDVLIDMRDADDAGAVRLERHQALVHTVDVIAPIVDDPETFGRVAAANALSDVYAMGADPACAVAILALPERLPKGAIAPMMRGSAGVLGKAGAHLVGGHTLKGQDLLLGFAVTGTVESKRLITNRGAAPQQVLLLTKPLGTGVLYEAMRQGVRSAKETKAAVASMTSLNRAAKDAMIDARVRCATDVTGFGLAGHALNIAEASGVDVILYGRALPMLDGVRGHLAAGVVPAAAGDNAKGCGRRLVVTKGVAADAIALVTTPETSGGILMAVDRAQVEGIARRLQVHEVGEIRRRRTDKPSVRLEA
jgi:selenide,water dikinase